MRGRGVLVAFLLAAAALWVWRSQLFVVSRPGEAPRALAVRPIAERTTARLEVVLPTIPVGMTRLETDGRVTLLHYWAPWEQHGAIQAALLDSLGHLEQFASLRVALVCFDPFPSVARYVARHRLRVKVVLDTERRLRRALPCPSVPFTYVLDAEGRVAVAQAGEVDWFADSTRGALDSLIRETAPGPRPNPGSRPS